MIEILEITPLGLRLRASGEITARDYRQVLPSAKAIVAARGSFSAVVDIMQVQRLSFGAIWEDAKFDLRYFRKTDRIAYIGPRRTWLWLTSIPFATGGVRFFKSERMAQAWAFREQSANA